MNNDVPAPKEEEEEPKDAPNQLQDEPKQQGSPLEEVNLSNSDEKRPVFIAKDLPEDMKIELVNLLKEYKDVFAWTYDEMPGLSATLVTHKLAVSPQAKPVKQAPRNSRPDVQLQIKAEIEKLINAGFIKSCSHPQWLANIVPVKKKNGQIRCCVDYRDLNKACPKDEFPLPNLDTLIDATAGHEMFSFMDGFSGYNQIRMAPEDAEKTAFRTPFGNFYYVVMPFGLKNAGATYQRAMTAIFHDMIHGIVEDYVDDIVIKSRRKEDHVLHLKRVFERCRKYQLKMNPFKCAFGVSAGKFLGFVVHKDGISIDTEKANAILKMEPPKNQKQLKSFIGKISYLRRFIPGLAEIASPLQVLLRKKTSFMWDSQQQASFDHIKRTLASPQVMISPSPDKPLILYLTTTEKSVGALLAQEHDGIESPVYYLSRLMKGAECNYTTFEKHCLSLVYTAQRLRHYMLSHKTILITKDDPIRFMMSKPMPSSRLTRWMLLLSEFDISVEMPRAIKGQALADLLAQFPHESTCVLRDELPMEPLEIATCEIIAKEDNEWVVTFDGSSTSQGGGVGVVITDPYGEDTAIACRLGFNCSNNEAEYEALITGLKVVQSRGASKILIQGDSRLVVQQLIGEFAVKESVLAKYRTILQNLLANFKSYRLQHIPRTQNRYADALATMASKMEMKGESIKTFTITSKNVPYANDETTTMEQWQKDIIERLKNPKSINYKQVRNFALIDGVLYYRSPCGALSRCITKEEAVKRLKEIHNHVCGIEGPPMIKRLQRAGYYWPGMVTDIADVVRACNNCQYIFEAREAILHVEEGDWRTPYVEYLSSSILPVGKVEVTKFKRHASKYCIDDGKLYRKAYGGALLRCLGTTEANEVMVEIHKGDCGEHQGGRKLFEELLRIGYYWPTMEKDAMDFVNKCNDCQIFGNRIHAPTVPLHSVSSPYPFHTWALDFIGPISPPSKGRIWILTATECFTKWAEAIPLKKASSENVAMFILEHIICRFGIPKRILSDNGTPFIGKGLQKLLEGYQIFHGKSSRYYPQGNGIAEAFNKLLVRVLSRTVHENPKMWHEFVPLALWAYRTSRRGSTKFTPFTLVYGSEAVLPAEVAIPSARLAKAAGIDHEASRLADLEVLEEKREKAQENVESQHEKIARAYDKLVRPRIFQKGDLVLQAADHIMRGTHATKFSPNWEGPYVVEEIKESGYCCLKKVNGGKLLPPTNVKYIKKYYA